MVTGPNTTSWERQAALRARLTELKMDPAEMESKIALARANPAGR